MRSSTKETYTRMPFAPESGRNNPKMRKAFSTCRAMSGVFDLVEHMQRRATVPWTLPAS